LGKTTALRMLTTLLRPTAGTAVVAGCDLLRDPLGVRMRIGYVPQAIGQTAGGTDPNCLVSEEMVDPGPGVRPAGRAGGRADQAADRAAWPDRRRSPGRPAAPAAGVLIGLLFVAVVAMSLSATSYAVGPLLKSEDALAPLLNMVMVPLMLLSGIMLPMTLGPHWLRDAARVTPFGYIINAMRDAFAGHYFTTVVAERVAVAIGLAIACLWLAGRALRQGECPSPGSGRRRRGSWPDTVSAAAAGWR
jgi:hypothetical protein